MRLLAAILLVATAAEAQRAYPLALPRGCRDRSCVRGRTLQSSASGASWTAIESVNFLAVGGTGTLPPNDSSVVFTALPNLDGGNTWEVYDDGGVAMTTTQGTGEVFGTILGQRAMLDITDARHPFTTDARLRAMFLTDWTVMCVGYCTTRGNATTQVIWDQYDGTHEVSMYGQGTAVRISNDGTSHFSNSDTAYGQPVDGVGIFWGRQQALSDGGVQLCAGMMDTASMTSCINHAAPAAMTSGHMDWGAFPSPFTGNACRGNLLWCKGYASAQATQWLSDAVWNWWGVNQPRAMLSNSLTHDVPQIEGQFSASTGHMDVIHAYGVLNDPTLAIGTQHAFTNYCFTPTDVSLLSTVGGPTIDGNIAGGALSQWKNTTPAGRVWNKDGGTGSGVDAGSLPNLDGGYGNSTWANCSVIAEQGDAGTTIDTYRLQWVWGGQLDGGVLDTDGGCNYSGLSATPARTPDGGCYGFFVSPTQATCLLLVPKEGSIIVSQAQVSASIDEAPPTVDNGSKGVGWVALDGGALQSGSVRGGGIQVVAQYPFDFPSVTSADIRGQSGFLEDAFDSGAPNHIVTHTYGSQATGLEMLGIVYGPSFGTENFLLTPFSLPGRIWFAVAIKWETNGSQCRAYNFIDLCPSNNPAGCNATTQVNVGTWGECPAQADTVYLGNRFDNSDNQHVNFASITFYQQN